MTVKEIAEFVKSSPFITILIVILAGWLFEVLCEGFSTIIHGKQPKCSCKCKQKEDQNGI